ncbi:MAG: hypothetical protein ACLFV2_03705 [Desulfurivibrionaceae bacterium]
MRGAVFVAEKFRFSNGAEAKKLLVLLNNPNQGDPYFFVKTTSKQHRKPREIGCIGDYHQVYFVKAKSDFFEIDTWIQLDDYFPFEPNYVTNYLHHKGELTEECTQKVVDCFLQINNDDLSPRMRKVFEPPLEQGIRALADKFNRR